MAVTAKWYGKALEGQYGATAARRVDWVTDSVKIALDTSAYTPDQDLHDFWNDVSGSEVANGNGYTTGGIALASKTVAYDAGSNELRLDAADVSWTSATFTARYAVVYVDTAGASSTDPVLGYIDFGGDQTVSSGTFDIVFNASGVLKITAS